MQIAQKPAKVYADIKARFGEFGYAAWHGFAYTHGHNGAIMLIADSHTLGKFTPDRIELYVPDNGMYTTQGYCERNAPYFFQYDIASGGNSITVGRTYIFRIDGNPIRVQKGVVIDKDGHCSPLGGLAARTVNKAKTKEALKTVRERLVQPFATSKLLGLKFSAPGYTHVSDKKVLDAIVNDNTDKLAYTNFVTDCQGTNDYDEKVRNFINRCRPQIYDAFGCYEPTA